MFSDTVTKILGDGILNLKNYMKNHPQKLQSYFLQTLPTKEKIFVLYYRIYDYYVIVIVILLCNQCVCTCSK
jgi:hypothetical protein